MVRSVTDTFVDMSTGETDLSDIFFRESRLFYIGVFILCIGVLQLVSKLLDGRVI